MKNLFFEILFLIFLVYDTKKLTNSPFAVAFKCNCPGQGDRTLSRRFPPIVAALNPNVHTSYSFCRFKFEEFLFLKSVRVLSLFFYFYFFISYKNIIRVYIYATVQFIVCKCPRVSVHNKRTRDINTVIDIARKKIRRL